MELKTVQEIVRQAELDDKMGQTTSSRYVITSQRDDIDKTEAYLNSKHTSGETDHQGREKPFFDIVTSARNVWYRATDIDTKNILIRATKESDELKAFLATLLLQQWMKKERFGTFLNDWGLTLASHGSAVVKFVEKEGELSSQVIDWNTLLCDSVDFVNNPVIEKLWYTPAQLKKQQNWDKALVKKLLDSLTTRTTMEGQQKDNKADYICVYEVHGELPLSYLTGKETDEDEYVQQMHIITFQQKKDSTKEFEDYTLFSGREKRNPYMLTQLIKKDGLTYVGGAVKNLFQAQWMVNDTIKKQRDQLELASKLIFQTSDGNLVGQNVLSDILNGQILLHKENSPITQLNNRPDISAMQAFQQQWQGVSREINGISEAMMGQTQPSGTAWRQTQALLQESHSLFELMTENKGNAIKDMLTTFVIPYFKKQLDTSDEIAGILEDYQIKQIDARYVPNEAIRRVNDKIKETVLSGQIYDPTQQAGEIALTEEALKKDLASLGNQRFIKPSDIETKTWAEIFDDLEWDLDIDVTGESKDTQGAMATLTTVFQTLVSNPSVLSDPNVRLVFGKILGLTGSISPIEIVATQAQPVPQAQVGGQPMSQLTQPNPM